MDNLVKAAFDFLAAVLRVFGFVGQPRRREAIQDDMKLLGVLRASVDFGPESPAHHFLVNHITLQVAKFAGVGLERKKKVPWRSVVLALMIGAPLGYWTYDLDHAGFHWISLLPGVISGLMFLAVLGMLFGESDNTPDVGDTLAPSDP